jgi:DNA gyrase subunit B
VAVDCQEISDCSEQDPAKCEVYLVEEIRLEERQNKVDRAFQAICHYIGKILNVEKQCTIRFENEEIRNIFTALGVTVGTAKMIVKL